MLKTLLNDRLKNKALEKDAQRIPINRQTWDRVVEVIRKFAASEVGGRAKKLAILLITLLFGINTLACLAIDLDAGNRLR